MPADTPTAAGTAILATLAQALTDMTREWDLEAAEAIAVDTWFIADLGFSSMDLVMLVVDVKARYDGHDFPFEDLFAPGGEYVADLRVGDMVAFLEVQLAARSAGAAT